MEKRVWRRQEEDAAEKSNVGVGEAIWNWWLWLLVPYGCWFKSALFHSPTLFSLFHLPIKYSLLLLLLFLLAIDPLISFYICCLTLRVSAGCKGEATPLSPTYHSGTFHFIYLFFSFVNYTGLDFYLNGWAMHLDICAQDLFMEYILKYFWCKYVIQCNIVVLY